MSGDFPWSRSINAMIQGRGSAFMSVVTEALGKSPKDLGLGEALRVRRR